MGERIRGILYLDRLEGEKSNFDTEDLYGVAISAEFDVLGAAWGRIEDYCTVFDTLKLAREMHPGQRNSLDALCRRYEIDNAHREIHGALLDAELLAEVYLAMTGGQGALELETKSATHTRERNEFQRGDSGRELGGNSILAATALSVT